MNHILNCGWRYERAEMMLAVEQTTYAVEKEPIKIQAWPVIEPWRLRWPDATLYLKLIPRWWKWYERKYTKWLIFWTVDKDMKVMSTIGYITNSQWPSLQLAWIASWIERCVRSSQRLGFDSWFSTAWAFYSNARIISSFIRRLLSHLNIKASKANPVVTKGVHTRIKVTLRDGLHKKLKYECKQHSQT